MPAGFVIPTIFTAVNQFSGPLKVMGNAVQQFASKSAVGLAYAERGWRKLMAPINSVGKMLNGFGFYVGLYSLIRLLKDAVGIMADFQQAQVNISAVTGQSVAQNKLLADQARQIGVQYGIAATRVSELQYELIKMGFSQMQVYKMTPSIATGAVAMRTTPELMAENVAATLKTFNMDASRTQEVVDMFSKIADITALDAPTLFTMLPNAQIYAKKAGLELSDLLAVFGALRDSMLHTASASTGFKNVLIDSSVKGKDYREQLMKITQSENALRTAYKMFGRRTATTALIAGEGFKPGANGRSVIGDFKEILENRSAGYAAGVAAKQLNTLHGALAKARTSYEEFILTIESGEGPIAKFLSTTVQTFSAMLLWSSGSKAATWELAHMKDGIAENGYNLLQWVKVIKWIVIILASAKLIMMAWAVVTLAGTAATGAYNIVLGVMGALTGLASVRIGKSTIALAAYNVTTWLATTATGSFAVALGIAGLPMWALCLIIAALIALSIAVIAKWNEWGAAASFLLGPIGLLIGLVQTFRRNWEMIGDAFANGGILKGILAIGAALFDVLLMPLQQLFKIINDITGAKWAANAAKSIEDFRGSMGLNISTDESGNPVKTLDPDRDKAAASSQFNGPFQDTRRVKVDFGNVPAGTTFSGDKELVGSVKPTLGSTLLDAFSELAGGFGKFSK